MRSVRRQDPAQDEREEKQHNRPAHREAEQTVDPWRKKRERTQAFPGEERNRAGGAAMTGRSVNRNVVAN